MFVCMEMNLLWCKVVNLVEVNLFYIILFFIFLLEYKYKELLIMRGMLIIDCIFF